MARLLGLGIPHSCEYVGVVKETLVAEQIMLVALTPPTVTAGQSD